jgi:hypothetical protein
MSRLFLLIIIIAGGPSVIGHWRIERVILEDEVTYDRRDSAISKENFITRQKRTEEIGKQYYGLQMQPYSYDMFRRSIENTSIRFYDTGEYETIEYSANGNRGEGSKGRYKFLPSSKLLVMTADDQTDTLAINLSDTTMELISSSKGSRSNYVYSRIK